MTAIPGTISTTSVPQKQSFLAESENLRPPERKIYLVGLDSLRAIAALSVCLYHFTNGALPKVVVPFTQQLFSRGTLGVEIFFVISGFIIPYSLFGKNYRVAGFFAYLKKRIVRINPPAYIAMLLVVGQWFLIDKLIQHSNNYTKELSIGQAINNLLFTVPFTDYGWIIGIFWTLAIEFQFYIFIGLLFVTMFEQRHTGWFVGCYLLASIVNYLPGLTANIFFQYSTLFALGGSTLLWQQKRLTKLAYAGYMLLFAGLAYWQLGGYVAGVGLGTALAINALKFSVPGLSFIGKMSYSFYLLHILIGTTCEFVLVKIISPITDANKVLITLLALTASLIGGYIYYRLVEQPFMRLAAKQR